MKQVYNKAVRLPEKLALRFATKVRLCFSHHAKLECVRDRYGVVNPPRELEITVDRVVEVETENDVPVKAVVRVPYDSRRDLVLVLNTPEGGSSFVRTVWTNLTTDNHATLRRGLVVA